MNKILNTGLKVKSVMENTNYKRVLIKPVFFILSLLTSTYFVFKIEKLRPSDFGSFQTIFHKEVIIEKRADYPLRNPSGMLSEEELQYAKIAWKYFENNYNEQTGFVSGVDKQSVTTIKDLSNYLMGMISAYEIGIIDSLTYDKRLKQILHSLRILPLCNDALPNRTYEVSSLKMLDRNNQYNDLGSGWSAMDIGRFFTVVNKIVLDYPQYHYPLKAAIRRWKMEYMIEKGYLFGGYINNNNHTERAQEGTLGYEENSAKALFMAGYDVSQALSYTDFLKFVDVYGQKVGVDTRRVNHQPGYNYIHNEPYLLDGVEYGWDVDSKELAYRLFHAQKERYNKTRLLTALSEDHIDAPPYYVYNCVYAADKIWSCLDANGNDTEDLRYVSTKAAFGWHVLYEDDYARLLFNVVKPLYDSERGWYTGRYEKTGIPNKVITASTNGFILEALNYKLKGKIIGRI